MTKFLIVIVAFCAVANAFVVKQPALRLQTRSALSTRPLPVMQMSAASTIQPSTTALSMSTGATAADAGMAKRLKVGSLFGLWYALNIGYNIYNKKLLNMVPSLTYIVGWMQLAMGLFYVIPMWASGLRKTPELSADDIKTLTPIAILHSLTHLGAIVSLGAGAVSFTHIVKAAEPAVSAAMSAVFLKSFLPLPVYLTLVPVMGGVALASLSELSFNWLAFGGAMVSNVASAGRGIVGKISMGKPLGKNMNAVNLYAVMTILSTILCLPVCFFMEGANIGPVLAKIAAAGQTKEMWKQMILSALFYYSYNEVAFLALDNVAPVTHALGNTIKRVVIILTSVLVFGTKMTSRGALGSAIAIGGVLLYSLAKDYFK